MLDKNIQEFLNYLPLPGFILRDGLFLLLNSEMARIAGTTPEEMRHTSFQEFIYPDDRPLLAQIELHPPDQSREPPLHYELRAITRQNRIIWVSVFFSAVLYDCRPAIFGQLVDITRQKREEEASLASIALDNARLFKTLKEELADRARLEKSRRQFLTNISHDLRTPMTLIQGYVEAILDGIIIEPEQQNKYLKLIHNKILGLNRLTWELFELTQLESRQVELNLNKVPIFRLIRKIHDKYNLDVEAAGISLILSSPADSSMSEEPMVEVDINRIERVFVNLIFNAIKYTPQGGTIEIGYSTSVNPHLNPLIESKKRAAAGAGGNLKIPGENEEKFVLITVTDSGTGITEEDIPHIFERFYRGATTRKSDSGNSGLGLAITREIIELHGGRIWVSSILNQGSTFYFTLPVCGPAD